MGYYADSISDVRVTELADGLSIAASTSYDGAQLYVSGSLHGYERAVDGKFRFFVSSFSDTDVFFLLAVDAADAETDYSAEAFPSEASNRIRVRFYVWPGYLPGDKLRIYVDGVIVKELPIFEGGRYVGGWGSGWGETWGYDRFGPGWGHNWGKGPWGFDCHAVEHKSEPKCSATYLVEVSVVDLAGNESGKTSESVTISTYPRPAAGLTVESYDKGTGELVLSFVESPDLL